MPCARTLLAGEESSSQLEAGLGDCCHHPFEGPSVVEQYAPHSVLAPVHIHAQLDFTRMAEQRLSGTVAITVRRSTGGGSTTDKQQDDSHMLAPLARMLTLNAVAFSEVKAECKESPLASSTYNGKELALEWSAPFEHGEERTVVVRYVVERPVSGMFFVAPSARRWLPDSGAAGKLHVITDHETERARYWLPCVDFPAVRTTLRFDITAPGHMVALATGKRTAEALSADGKTKCSTWELTDDVCPSYLICLAVGDYERVVDETVDGIPLEYYGPSGYLPADIKRAFDKTPSMIRWMQKKLDLAFPWPKYFQVASSDIRGAMENISLVTWSEKYLMDEVWAKERRLIMDTVNVHEMAHTYFGDLVVIRHFDHVWMKESWATYMESVWIQDHLTTDDFRFEMLENADSYMSETETYMRPLVNRNYASSWNMYDAHTYPGGCWRIHMLRCMLGDRLFWSAVSKYLKSNRGKVVETEDFRRVLETESGLNLTQFFQEWYYSCGFPKFKASMAHKKETRTVTITLEQTQVDKAKNVPLFHVPVEVEVEDAEGVVYRGVAVFHGDATKAFVTLAVGDSAPAMVRIDPDGNILCTVDFNHGETTLGAVARGGKDVVSRIRAFYELIKIGSPTAMATVHDALLAEPFYGVRVKVANKLSETKSTSAIRTLCALLVKEQHPLALWRVAKACNIRDDVVRKALHQKLKDAVTLPYRAQEFLYENLGLQAHADDLDVLMTLARDDKRRGYHDFVRCGVLRALGNHRSEAAYTHLLSVVRQPKSEKAGAFAAAVDGLARSVLWQEDAHTVKYREVVDLLTALVARDEFESVRRAAIAALQRLGAKQSAEVVLASRPMYAEQDWPSLEAAAARLRANGGKGAAVGELTKRVEELETKLRKVEEKLAEPKAESKVESKSNGENGK